MIVISAEVRDPAIVHDLERLRPDGFQRGTCVPIVTARRAGEGRVTAVVTETRTASGHDVELSADVTWADGSGGSMGASFSGLSPDDQTELGLRAGLLAEPLPPQVDGNFGFMIDTSDPLAELEGLMLAGGGRGGDWAPAGRRPLLGAGRASRIERFALGPAHLGERRVELEYVEPRRYANHEPGLRRIEGARRVPS
jgi:hypothetical protein